MGRFENNILCKLVTKWKEGYFLLKDTDLDSYGTTFVAEFMFNTVCVTKKDKFII